MVGKKLDEVFSSLKDNFLFIFSVILLSITIISCERSFQSFDKNLMDLLMIILNSMMKIQLKIIKNQLLSSIAMEVKEKQN